MKGDNAKLRAVDEAMGWVEKDGSSPATVAESQAVAGHIIGHNHGLPVVAWKADGVWSYCVLNYHGLTATLLAKSRSGITDLLNTLRKRVTDEQSAASWQSYYHALWKRRYRKWCCLKPKACNCQLCRIALAKTRRGKRG